jgi:hypothetical protein
MRRQGCILPRRPQLGSLDQTQHLQVLAQADGGRVHGIARPAAPRVRQGQRRVSRHAHDQARPCYRLRRISTQSGSGQRSLTSSPAHHVSLRGTGECFTSSRVKGPGGGGRAALAARASASAAAGRYGSADRRRSRSALMLAGGAR